MYKTSIFKTAKKFADCNDFRGTIDVHDFAHAYAGAKPGMDNENLNIFEFESFYCQNLLEYPKKAIILNAETRKAYVDYLAAQPAALYRHLCNRNEMLAGFALDLYYPTDLSYDYRLTTPQDAFSLGNEADIPFYLDDYLIRQHKIYLTHTMINTTLSFVPHSKTKNNMSSVSINSDMTFSIAENGEELTQLIDDCMPICEDLKFTLGGGTVLYALSKGWSRDEALPYGIGYSGQRTVIGSTAPMIFTPPQDHMLYGSNLDIVVVDLPTDVKSFELCMDAYDKREWKNVYENDPAPYIEKLEKGCAMQVASPYEANSVYHTYVGNHDVYAVPQEAVKARMTMPVSAMIHNFRSKPDGIKTYIERNIRPV